MLVVNKVLVLVLVLVEERVLSVSGVDGTSLQSSKLSGQLPSAKYIRQNFCGLMHDPDPKLQLSHSATSVVVVVVLELVVLDGVVVVVVEEVVLSVSGVDGTSLQSSKLSGQLPSAKYVRQNFCGLMHDPDPKLQLSHSVLPATSVVVVVVLELVVVVVVVVVEEVVLSVGSAVVLGLQSSKLSGQLPSAKYVRQNFCGLMHDPDPKLQLSHSVALATRNVPLPGFVLLVHSDAFGLAFTTSASAAQTVGMQAFNWKTVSATAGSVM